MNYIDVLIIVGLVIYGLLGFRRGFIRELSDIIILVLSLAFAGLLYDKIGLSQQGILGFNQSFSRTASFFIVWFLSELMLNIIALYAIDRIPENHRHSNWNLWLGTVLGSLKAAMIFVFILITVMVLPIGGGTTKELEDSFIARYVSKQKTFVNDLFVDTFTGAAEALSSFVTVTSGSDDAVQLGYTVTNPTLDKRSVQAMLVSVNSERAKAGLDALTLDDKLSEVAGVHAKDMFARGYVSHYTPEGISPFDRMASAGIKSFFAGENIALAADIESAMTGLMESAGHRANILSGDYNKIGISVYDGGVHGKMFVQEFTD